MRCTQWVLTKDIFHPEMWISHIGWATGTFGVFELRPLMASSIQRATMEQMASTQVDVESASTLFNMPRILLAQASHGTAREDATLLVAWQRSSA